MRKILKYNSDFLKQVYLKACLDDADIVLFKVDYIDKTLSQTKVCEWEKKFFRMPATATFKASSIPVDKFTSFTYRVGDKFYKKAFLDQHALRFSSQGMCYGDMRFIYDGLFQAERIAYTSQVLGLRNIQCKLWHSEIYPWTVLRQQLMDYGEELRKRGMTDSVEQDFVNFSLFVAINEFSMVSSKEFSQRYTTLREYDFAILGITGHDKNYFYDRFKYQQFDYIRSNEFMWRVIRECIGVNTVDDEGQQ